MLKWRWVVAIVCLVAGATGFSEVVVDTGLVTRLLFCVFLVMFVAVLLIALLGSNPTDGER